MSNILATAIVTGKKTNRGTFLQQNVPTEEVPVGYFKTGLAVYEMSKKGKRVILIDAFGGRVLWGFETKKYSYNVGMVRFSTVVCKKGKRGFMVKGKFIQF